GALKLIGTATIAGKRVVREVRSATITWPVPQPAPTVTRLDRELVLAVRDRPPFTLLAESAKITINQGERISIPVKVHRLDEKFQTAIQVTALALPPGYAVQPLTLAPGKDSGTLNVDGKGMASAGVFTVILRGVA